MSVNKVNSDGSLLRVAGGTLYADSPIGTIVPYGGSNIPKGYLLCDGAEVLKTTYAELYAVIGDAFGTASVNTKFVLPDLREATTKGAGLTGKSNNHYDSDGVALGEFIDDQVQNFRIRTTESSGGDGDRLAMGTNQTAQATPYLSSLSDNIRQGATTEVKSVGVNYIIKAKQVALPADFAPVDTVENDNMKSVTSNAVYDYISSLSGVTPVGEWKLIRLGSSELYLGFYYHNNITPDVARYDIPVPNGYSCVQHYFAQCFQEGYTKAITGATHIGDRTTWAMRVYFEGSADTGYNYEVRACCLFQKNS